LGTPLGQAIDWCAPGRLAALENGGTRAEIVETRWVIHARSEMQHVIPSGAGLRAAAPFVAYDCSYTRGCCGGRLEAEQRSSWITTDLWKIRLIKVHAKGEPVIVGNAGAASALIRRMRNYHFGDAVGGGGIDDVIVNAPYPHPLTGCSPAPSQAPSFISASMTLPSALPKARRRVKPIRLAP
jgi:hypothetical protein